MSQTEEAAVTPLEQEPAEAVGQTGSTPRRSNRWWAAVAAFLFTLVGWLLLPFTYLIAGGAALAGIVFGIVGWRARRGAWRNLAITATVAAFTLLLVLAVFFVGIYYLANM